MQVEMLCGMTLIKNGCSSVNKYIDCIRLLDPYVRVRRSLKFGLPKIGYL